MSSAAKLTMPPHAEEQRREFALWSRIYDELPNPLLALEERFLAPLLPDLQGKDVLDVGCGTGRWLERLQKHNPRSLTGVDFSPEMVARARRKVKQTAVVTVGDATSLSIASRSDDVIIASFVASYVPNIDAFARELRRVARAKSRIYISDVHPETVEACHWKRGFRNGDRQVKPATYQRSLAATISSLRNAGFRITCLLEPPFGAPELDIFRSAGKLEAFDAAAGLPAIYILEAKPDETRTTFVDLSSAGVPEISLRGARIALDGDASITSDIEIRDGWVSTIASTERLHDGQAEPASVHLNGYLLLPGLINAHDHLEFGLYSNLGRGPYRNASEWAHDIQKRERATIAAHQSVPRDVRLWWGAIRNLLCGVTTVCHHNPLHPELMDADFPIRVPSHCNWAHSLAMDAEVRAKFRSTPHATPFVLHAGEGVDEAAADEVFELDRLNALDERTILVHGLALGPEGIDLLNDRDATLVWCPSSNRYLFSRTHSSKTIAGIRRVLLGSDSPLTAAGDLLDEVRIAHREAGVSASDLYRMLFERAAQAFRLQEGQGTIRPDAAADLIAVRDKGLSPAEIVANLRAADVELVLVGGRVQVASGEVFRRLPPELSRDLRPLEVESSLRWVRAPLGRLFREAHRALGCDIKLGGKRVRHVCSAWL